jgi:hypothetical protein
MLSSDCEANKITSDSFLNLINRDTINLNTTISVLSDSVDIQFELTTTYIEEKITEQHEYTDQEIEALRTEGYIQEALNQALAWVTSDEGKRFRKSLVQNKFKMGIIYWC